MLDKLFPDVDGSLPLLIKFNDGSKIVTLDDIEEYHIDWENVIECYEA
jgi:hypothetical protein